MPPAIGTVEEVTIKYTAKINENINRFFDQMINKVDLTLGRPNEPSADAVGKDAFISVYAKYISV